MTIARGTVFSQMEIWDVGTLSWIPWDGSVTGGGGGGGGADVQYVEDAVAPANPIGTALAMVRSDFIAPLTSTDGDIVAARGTDHGELYVFDYNANSELQTIASQVSDVNFYTSSINTKILAGSTVTGTLALSGDTVVIDTTGMGTVGIDITGSFGGGSLVGFEALPAGGSSYRSAYAFTDATTPGKSFVTSPNAFVFNCAGYTSFRVRLSSVVGLPSINARLQTSTVATSLGSMGMLYDPSSLYTSSISVGGLLVDGSNVTQPVSAASLPLPTGASTSALQSTGNTSLGNIDTKTPALGQTTMAGSSPVVIASDQSAVPVSGTVTTSPPANASTNVAQLAGTTTDTNSGTKSAGTLRVVLATDQPALTNKLLVTPDSVALPLHQSVNVDQIGGAALAIGQQLAAASIPVVLPAATVTTLTPPAAITGFALDATLTGGTQTARLTDGTNTAAVKAASTAAVAADPALVMRAVQLPTALSGSGALKIAGNGFMSDGYVPVCGPGGPSTGGTVGVVATAGLSAIGSSIVVDTTNATGVIVYKASSAITGSGLFEVSPDGGTTWFNNIGQSGATDWSSVSPTQSFSEPVGPRQYYFSTAGFNRFRIRITSGLSSTVSFTTATVVPSKVTDGVTAGTIKVASTLPALTDTALVTTQRDPLPAGTNVIGALTANQSVNHAQIAGVTVSTGNGVPDTGTQRVFSAQRRTYSASTTAKTATAAGTAPFFSITGSGTQTIRVQKIIVSGTVATAAIYGDIVLKKTSTATSGGTATALTRAPHDSNSAAATATVNYYTVLPTAGASVGVVQAQSAVFPLTGTVAAAMAQLSFLDMNRDPVEAIVLRGTAQCLEMSFGTTPTNAPTLHISVTWTEE